MKEQKLKQLYRNINNQKRILWILCQQIVHFIKFATVWVGINLEEVNAFLETIFQDWIRKKQKIRTDQLLVMKLNQLY